MKKIVLSLVLIFLLLLGVLVGCNNNVDITVNSQNDSSTANILSSDVNVNPSNSQTSSAPLTSEEKEQLEEDWNNLVSNGNLIIETGNSNTSTSTSTTTSITTSNSDPISSQTTSIDPESNESLWGPWIPLK